MLLTLNGESMHPTFSDGDKVLISNNTKEIDRGEIVAFHNQTSDKIIVHRSMGKFQIGDRSFLIEKGDSSSLARPISREAVVGKVIEAFDADGNKIDDRLWKREAHHYKIIEVIYKFAYYIKEKALKKKKYFVVRFFCIQERQGYFIKFGTCIS